MTLYKVEEEGQYAFDENEFIPLQSQKPLLPQGQARSILENPIYKRSPFYPHAEDVKRADADTKRAHGAVDDLCKHC